MAELPDLAHTVPLTISELLAAARAETHAGRPEIALRYLNLTRYVSGP